MSNKGKNTKLVIKFSDPDDLVRVKDKIIAILDEEVLASYEIKERLKY